MKKKRVIKLESRVAVLEARVTSLEESHRCEAARNSTAALQIGRANERLAELLRLAWEVLRTTRPEILESTGAGHLREDPARTCLADDDKGAGD